MISNSEIRARARETLGKGILSVGWLYPVLILLCVIVITTALTGTFVGPFIVSGLIGIATAAYFIARVRGSAQPQDLGVAIRGVSGCFLNSILATLLYELFVFIGTLLFIVPGILFSYSFSMLYFVMNDHPEYGPLEVLRESRRLMRGHRWQLFCLHFSFIGWGILGALCLGIGALWVSAYSQTASAVFYEELINNDRGYFTVNEPAEESSQETN